MTTNKALHKATQEKEKGNEFGWAWWSLIAKDIEGANWLKKPFTKAELKRPLAKYSDYGAQYWTTEAKGSFGALKCDRCDKLVKRQWPWFRVKECWYHDRTIKPPKLVSPYGGH